MHNGNLVRWYLLERKTKFRMYHFILEQPKLNLWVRGSSIRKSRLVQYF